MYKIAFLTCHFLFFLLKIRFYRSEISPIMNMDIVTYAFFSVERASLYFMLCRFNPLKSRNLAIANCSVSSLSYQVMMFYLASLSQLISLKSKANLLYAIFMLKSQKISKISVSTFCKVSSSKFSLHRIQKWNM